MSNAASIRHYFIKVVVFIAIIILARVFIFELFAISGSSMSHALLSGDKLIISKVHYGAIIPRSPYEIPIVNIPFYLFGSSPDQRSWSTRRVPGFSRISRTDIVVFEKNYENWLPRTRLLIVELHDRMQPGSSKAVFNAITKYDFICETKWENLIFYNRQKL